MPPTRSRLSSNISLEKSQTTNGDNGQPQTQFITNKRCPYAQKAWIALEASQCPYEMREVSLYGAGGKPDWFWELNPEGTVPIVVSSESGGKKAVFADSELILDAVGNGCVGTSENMLSMSETSEEEKAKIAQWRNLVSTRLAPVGKSAVLSGSLPKLRSLLKELNEMVERPYLAGDGLTVADCAAFPFLWRIDQEFGIGGGTNEHEANLRAWLDKCMENEAVKRTIPEQGWWWWW